MSVETSDAQMPLEEDPWAAATHEGNEREQLQRGAKMTFTEKVRWLEAMQRISDQFKKGREGQNQKT